MAFTYTLNLVATQALHRIRSLIRDTKVDRPFLQDEEIIAQLGDRGLVAASDPVANRHTVYQVASECCRMIEAKFASESEIAITAIGLQKSTACQMYRALAKAYETYATSDAAPQFVDVPMLAGAPDAVHPSGYDSDFVAGVDPVPGL